MVLVWFSDRDGLIICPTDAMLAGYNMAKNLRAKIPASDTLIVRDVNEEAAKRFVAEAQETARNNGAGANEGRVEIAENAREVAERSVRDIGFL